MQSVITYILAHQAMFAAIAVAVLDFIFAVSPSWQSNGILHWLYTWFKGMGQPKASG